MNTFPPVQNSPRRTENTHRADPTRPFARRMATLPVSKEAAASLKLSATRGSASNSPVLTLPLARPSRLRDFSTVNPRPPRSLKLRGAAGRGQPLQRGRPQPPGLLLLRGGSAVPVPSARAEHSRSGLRFRGEQCKKVSGNTLVVF